MLYSRPGGHPELVNTLARFYSPRFGRQLDPMNEISTHPGAQGAFFSIVTAFCDKGDEVVLIEPIFDACQVRDTNIDKYCSDEMQWS